MFHLFSNTSNSYLSRFNETHESLNSSKKRSETLKMRRANIPGWFLLFPMESKLKFTSSTASGGWTSLKPLHIRHGRDTHLPRIPSEEKIGITNLIRFWTYSDKHNFLRRCCHKSTLPYLEETLRKHFL